MQINFDKTQKSVSEGFGLTLDKFKDIASTFEGKQINNVVDEVVNDEILTIEEKFAMMFEVGANFGATAMAQQVRKDAEDTILKAQSLAGDLKTH